MLTLKTILRATRQMGLYGELRTGALDHLSSKVTGHASDRRGIPLDDAGVHAGEPAEPARMVRVWDEHKGAYLLREE